MIFIQGTRLTRGKGDVQGSDSSRRLSDHRSVRGYGTGVSGEEMTVRGEEREEWGGVGGEGVGSIFHYRKGFSKTLEKSLFVLWIRSPRYEVSFRILGIVNTLKYLVVGRGVGEYYFVSRRDILLLRSL